MLRAMGFLTALLLALGAPGSAFSQNVRVQVNQVAMERTAGKAAIVEYKGSAPGGTFQVVSGENVVLSGPLTELPSFTEWARGTRYFQADLSSLRTAGKYKIVARLGNETATSPEMTIADGALFSVAGPALVEYFKLSRHVDPIDKRIRIYGTDRFVDVSGGWKDAGGDTGKYLSHLSYANHFNPQQAGFAVWALAKSHELAANAFRRQNAEQALLVETAWGADFLVRMLSPEGFFYMTVFDKWGTDGAERVVTAYVGRDGVYTEQYQAAYREGAGASIAALARAARLFRDKASPGQFTSDQYLQTARRAFVHLEANNLKYVDDGKENIIDDYTALLAATELYLATGDPSFLEASRKRAQSLNGRLTEHGWFRSDDRQRPFYHAVEAGLPVVALAEYLRIETDPARTEATKATIDRSLRWQLEIDRKVANPYSYPRQVFRLYDFKRKRPYGEIKEGFFIPHNNETGYWWQGESARLASLAVAAVLGGKIVAPDKSQAFGVSSELANFVETQLAWTLGRNPYGMSMLYGFGVKNPPYAESAGDMVRGGVSNGITGSDKSAEGRGITFAPGPDSENWRWSEQWVPHVAWMLLAASATGGEQPCHCVPAP